MVVHKSNKKAADMTGADCNQNINGCQACYIYLSLK